MQILETRPDQELQYNVENHQRPRSSRRNISHLFNKLEQTHGSSPHDIDRSTKRLSPCDESLSIDDLHMETSSSSSSSEELSFSEEGSVFYEEYYFGSPIRDEGDDHRQAKRHCSPQSSSKVSKTGLKELGFLNDDGMQNSEQTHNKMRAGISTQLTPERKLLSSMPFTSSSVSFDSTSIVQLPCPKISQRSVKNPNRKSPPSAPIKRETRSRHRNSTIGFDLESDLVGPVRTSRALAIEDEDNKSDLEKKFEKIIGKLLSGELMFQKKIFAVNGISLGNGRYKSAFEISSKETKKLISPYDNNDVIVKAFHYQCIEENKNQINLLNTFIQYSIEQYYLMQKYFRVAEIFNIIEDSSLDEKIFILNGNLFIQKRVAYSVDVTQWDFKVTEDASKSRRYYEDLLLNKEASDFPELVSAKKIFDTAALLIFESEGSSLSILDPDLQPDNLRYNDKETRELVFIDMRESRSDGDFDRVANLIKDVKAWSRDRLKVFDYLTSGWGHQKAFKSLVETTRANLVSIEEENARFLEECSAKNS